MKEVAGTSEGATRADVLVVGCGAMGSAVSYNLARRGSRVITLEKFGLNHSFGSSHGQTRIIRLAYYEDPRYVPLLRRAFESWAEAERRSGTELLMMTGGLMIGPPEGELVAGVLESARVHSIPHRNLTAKEAEDEYNAFSIDEDFVAVHEEHAGVLFPERCIEAFVGLASKEGCDFRFKESLKSWKSGSAGIEVETDRNQYTADRLVLCAGAWNGGLLHGMIPLQCERQVPFWFDSKRQERFSPEKMPVFIMEEEPGVFFYGIPEFGKGVKVARTHGGEACEADTIRREVGEEDSVPVERFVAKRLKNLALPAVESTTCLYTNTPDLNFAVGVHPKDPRVTVVSACSGHGFKFASVIGEVAADLSLTGETPLDVAFLGLQRFSSAH